MEVIIGILIAGIIALILWKGFAILDILRTLSVFAVLGIIFLIIFGLGIFAINNGSGLLGGFLLGVSIIYAVIIFIEFKH